LDERVDPTRARSGPLRQGTCLVRTGWRARRCKTWTPQPERRRRSWIRSLGPFALQVAVGENQEHALRRAQREGTVVLVLRQPVGEGRQPHVAEVQAEVGHRRAELEPG